MKASRQHRKSRHSPAALTAFLLLCPLLIQIPIACAESDEAKASKLCHEAYRVGITEKHYAQGIEILKRAIVLTPKDHWIHSTIGRCYMHMEQYEEAAPYLDQALNLAPTDVDEIENVTYCQDQLNHSQRVLDVATPYLSKHGKDAPAANLWKRVAHAHANLHQYNEAYNAYDHYFGLKASDPYDWFAACQDFQAPAAAKFFYPLYEEYARRFPHDSGVTFLAPKVRLMTQMARSSESAAKSDSFDVLITYKDPLHPNVSKQFYGMVKEGLRSIPRGLLESLRKYGCKVMLTPYITDVMTEGLDERPRGYKPGSTYRNVPAIFLTDKNYVTVAEFYKDEHGKETHNDDPAKSVCHELGHALDIYLGSKLDELKGKFYPHFSHGKSFSEAYLNDAKSLTASQRKALDYYIQSIDQAGQEELFAQLFPIIFDETAVIGSDDDKLAKAFPNTLKLIASMLQVELRSEPTVLKFKHFSKPITQEKPRSAVKLKP